MFHNDPNDKQAYEIVMRDEVAFAFFWQLLRIKKGLKDPETVKFAADVSYVIADAFMAARRPRRE